MAAVDQQALHDAFDDHPSLSASLEDFEHNGGYSDHIQQPLLHIPSHHSGFYQSDDGESELPESDSGGPWSPPISARFDIRNRGRGGGWEVRTRAERSPTAHAHQTISPARSSREPSPEYEDARDEPDLEGDTILPANIRLPSDSPERRLSPTPDPYPNGDGEFGKTFGAVPKDASTSAPAENANNFIRFAVRAEVQHRTEPFEAAFEYVRHHVDWITRSRTSSIVSIIVAIASYILLRLLLQPPQPGPVPDLVKVAGLAQSFEPLIFYSENGMQQIGDLQETGFAVWDLGESVRSTQLRSAPVMVQQLDELSETLKTLAIDLTKFFASVDGDVDGILLVMDWAKRELSQILHLPVTSVSTASDNVHAMLCRLGFYESSNGDSTRTGQVISGLFGPSRLQRTRRTLQRTFNEFLGVLEESIASELKMSMSLYATFESIDAQFLNLARTVVTEFDQQEREEGELLSTLWAQVLGPSAGALRKFERNKSLLSNVRERTLLNKAALNHHTGKLMTLKANLETLRQKLVSPLVRSNDSSTLSVEEQILGLDGTYQQLRTVRERQKGKLREMLYGVGHRRTALVRESEPARLDTGRGSHS
ncbi:MAG: hypothetical protein M1838_002152 [Thelocarpon superellum]|nr:MAG: hypothetical protein M1838_002152 [Thelocarpon superellum]